MDRRKFMKLSAATTASVLLSDLLSSRIADARTPSFVRNGLMANDDLKTLADVALETAKSNGALYADIRINRYENQSISTREKRVTNLSNSESYGFGVRVLLNGTWGFAASNLVTKDEIEKVTKNALAIARANSILRKEPVQLAPVKAYNDTWRTPVKKNPFEVSLSEKADFLLALNAEALKVKGATFCNSSMAFVREQKYFASTDGSYIQQEIIRTDPSFTVVAVDRIAGQFQSRSTYAAPLSAGYEYFQEYPFMEEVKQAAEDAVEKLSAKSVEPGKKDLILHPTNLWLTIHESVGHPTELDRALGYEANFAGTSFLTLDKLGKLKFGSDIVNLVADKTQPKGLATCAYDDEGEKTKEWHLVKDGIFVDYQTIRDQAHIIGRKESHGCCHADSWASVPFQRMPNVSLEPGKKPLSFEQLISDTEDAILIRGNGSFSIDHQRYNFQFSGQTFWEIKNGKIVGMLKDVAYQSRTPDFWNSCDAICSKEEYWLGGAMNDGKGEPGQSNAVSHGCAPARFRKVNILNTRRQV
jgi:TldD protein